MAFAMECANGATFALVPHVHPEINGWVSGLVGAFGNLGGIAFSLVYRFNALDYEKLFWIMGIIVLALQVPFLLVSV